MDGRLKLTGSNCSSSVSSPMGRLFFSLNYVYEYVCEGDRKLKSYDDKKRNSTTTNDGCLFFFFFFSWFDMKGIFICLLTPIKKPPTKKRGTRLFLLLLSLSICLHGVSKVKEGIDVCSIYICKRKISQKGEKRPIDLEEG